MHSAHHQPTPAPLASGTFRILRSHEKDLCFEGHLLGRAEHPGAFPSRPITISIYATAGGKYITQVERGELRDGSSPGAGTALPATSRAAVHDDPTAAFRWLLEDGRGKLGPVSKAAWDQACRNWPRLRGEDVELVP